MNDPAFYIVVNATGLRLSEPLTQAEADAICQRMRAEGKDVYIDMIGLAERERKPVQV